MFKKQKSENIFSNRIELTQNSYTLPFKFGLWCFVIKRAIFFTILFRKCFSSANYVCFNFSSYPRVAKELNWLSAGLKIANVLFRKTVHYYIKPEQWNSSEIEQMNKNYNKNVYSLTHPVYWVWILFQLRVIKDYSSILICLWTTRLKREMSKCDNKEQCLINQNVI